MHRRTLLTFALAATLLIGVPGAAIAQTGGLDEYQEGAPTAGGEQSGVPGSGDNRGDGGGGAAATSHGGSGSDSSNSGSPATTPTTPSPDSSPSASPSVQPATPPSTAAGASDTAGGASTATPSSGRVADGAPATGTAPAPTAEPVVVTATQPASDGDGSVPGVLLPIAIALLVVGLVGTLLYQWQNAGTRRGFARRPFTRGPAPSSG